MDGSDGFTLVQGISQYGMKKLIQKANINEYLSSHISDIP
jgi:hypothetical protein